MHDGSQDDVRQDLHGDGPGAFEALLTGGDPRSLRNADIVIDAASRQPRRLEELVQCCFSATRSSACAPATRWGSCGWRGGPG